MQTTLGVLMKNYHVFIGLISVSGLLFSGCTPSETAPAEGTAGNVSTAPAPSQAAGAKAGGAAVAGQAEAAMKAQADAIAKSKAGGK
jgi:hypothetical protein